MIYSLVTGLLIPGKLGEYNEIVTKELNPLRKKLGIKVVGAFHGYTGNMNEIYTLRVYDDLAAYQKLREAQQKDKDFQRVGAKLNALRVSLTDTLLEPHTWSAMK